MHFELLANELLFDVFEYLSFVDLLNGFQNLNNRFDNLIVDYCQTCQSLDFRLISKENLNFFRRRYLPSVVDHIENIYLSDSDRNPYEIDLFLSRLYPIYRFTNLKSISLESLYSIDKLKRLLNDLKQIPTLNSLKLIESYLENDPKKLVEIMNQIWSLENLQDCYLDFSFSSKSYFIVSTIFSCSIENLTIKGFQCSFEELAFLYEHTPNLKSLSIELTSSFDDDQSKLLLIPTLTQLNLKTSVSADFIVSLLKKTPCLNQLTIQTKNVYISGNKWQLIIENYLFYLQKFDFQMEFSSETDEHQEELDRIVKSFENSFWIEQRQWFIRCFSFKQNDLYFYNVHSLPFHFKHFNINFNENFSCKSTVPTDEQSSFKYNYVQNLDCSYSIVDSLCLPKFQFENVQNLTLSIGSEMNLFEFVKCRYENLRSVSIRIVDYLYQHEQIQQIQSILDQSPNLFHLAFTFWQRNFSKTKKVNSLFHFHW